MASIRVLVVDDSKLARMVVVRALGKLRPAWQVTEAANADEAIEAAAGAAVHIALLDYNMPGRDGLQLSAELRRAQPDLPVALISANIQDDIVAQARDGNTVFLPKPVTEDALAAFLDEAAARIAAGAAGAGR